MMMMMQPEMDGIPKIINEGPASKNYFEQFLKDHGMNITGYEQDKREHLENMSTDSLKELDYVVCPTSYRTIEVPVLTVMGPSGIVQLIETAAVMTSGIVDLRPTLEPVIQDILEQRNSETTLMDLFDYKIDDDLGHIE